MAKSHTHTHFRWATTITLAGVVTSVACASPHADGRTGTAGAALAGGDDDTGDPTVAATTAVLYAALPGRDVTCSAVLVAPRVALTASHCVAAMGPSPEVVFPQYLGHVETAAFPRVEGVPTLEQRPDDVAVLVLDEAALDADVLANPLPTWTTVLGLRTMRPSFAVPPRTPDGTFAPGVTVRGAGWADYPEISAPRAATVPGLGAPQTLGLLEWFHFGPPFWVPGDSGGPLFQVLASGKRDTFGILTAAVDTVQDGVPYQTPQWVDLSRPEVRDWVISKALDTRHGDGWLYRHGKAPNDLWHGEASYVGVCDTARDWDCDHWYNEHDNCPESFNPSQLDADADNVGDACDNCVAHPNYGQENCNARSERALGLAIMGDACDPVPCPNAQAKTRDYTACTGNHWVGQACQGWEKTADVFVNSIGSHPTSPTTPSPARGLVVSAVPTGFRFCQDAFEDGGRSTCETAAKIRDSAFDAPDPVQADGARVWYRVTTTERDSFGVGTTLLGPGTVTPLDYGLNARSFHWNYLTDATRWSTAGVLPLPRNENPCGATPSMGVCLDGFFWAHAVTAVGDTATSVGGTSVGAHGPDLANSFVPITPERFVTRYTSGIGLTTPYFFLWRTLPDPPWHGDPPRPFVPGDVVVVSHVPEVGARALVANGEHRDLTGYVSTPVTDALAQSGVIHVSAVEPSAPQSALPLALTLDAQGVVTTAIVERGGELRTEEELGYRTFAPSPLPTDASVMKFVYSRYEAAVFAVGAAGVWRMRMGEAWVRLVGPSRLRAPLGATYAMADGKLWVLDRNALQTRLLTIDALGNITTLATWAAGLRLYDRFDFSIDHDGRPILAMSSAQLQSTTLLAHIDAGSRRADKSGAIAAPFAMQLLVEPAAYSYVSRAATTNGVIVTEPGLPVLTNNALSALGSFF